MQKKKIKKNQKKIHQEYHLDFETCMMELWRIFLVFFPPSMECFFFFHPHSTPSFLFCLFCFTTITGYDNHVEHTQEEDNVSISGVSHPSDLSTNGREPPEKLTLINQHPRTLQNKHLYWTMDLEVSHNQAAKPITKVKLCMYRKNNLH